MREAKWDEVIDLARNGRFADMQIEMDNADKTVKRGPLKEIARQTGKPFLTPSWLAFRTAKDETWRMLGGMSIGTEEFNQPQIDDQGMVSFRISTPWPCTVRLFPSDHPDGKLDRSQVLEFEHSNMAAE